MPQTKALIVGCNYTGTDNQLQGCIPDALNMKQFIDEHRSFREVKLMTDTTPVKPTLANLLQAIEWLITDAKEGDTLWFSYSGHGSNVVDRNGDEKDGRDETLVPLDFKTAGMITDDQLKEYLDRLPAGVKLTAVMDCCHSETIMDLRDNVHNARGAKAPYRYLLERNPRANSTTADVVLISGCVDRSYSYDIVVDGKPTGALTYCFLDTLKQHNYDVDLGLLFIQTQRTMKKRKLSKQKIQLSFGREVDLNTRFLV